MSKWFIVKKTIQYYNKKEIMKWQDLVDDDLFLKLYSHRVSANPKAKVIFLENRFTTYYTIEISFT